MNDPFLTLLVEALNLMHPRFAAANPLHEFYHQFRRLWDKALPVQLGLGHLVLQPEPAAPPGPQPDLLVWQLEPERRLAAISFMRSDAIETLLRYRDLGYPIAVCIGYGVEPPKVEGIARLVYDVKRRSCYQPDA
jgi:hypothetical protein